MNSPSSFLSFFALLALSTLTTFPRTDFLSGREPSIIHNKRDGVVQAKSCDFFQELAHAHRIDVGVIGHRDELMGHCIECS